jgi:hypothetical protein
MDKSNGVIIHSIKDLLEGVCVSNRYSCTECKYIIDEIAKYFFKISLPSSSFKWTHGDISAAGHLVSDRNYNHTSEFATTSTWRYFGVCT